MPLRWDCALDPIRWTSSERWIRCPAWRSEQLGRRARRRFSDEFKDGAVRLVLDEGKTVGAVARELDLTASALEPVGPARARRADEGQERADEGRARGADPAPERESRAPHRARPAKKSLGPLRQEPAVVFATIDAERASNSVRTMCRTFGVSPSGFYAWRTPAGIDAGAGRPPPQSPRARLVHGWPRLLRQPAHLRRLRRVAGAGESEADHSPDAGGRA